MYYLHNFVYVNIVIVYLTTIFGVYYLKKITDTRFILPRVSAEMVQGVFESGTNKPFRVLGYEGPNDELKRYVLKANASERMYPGARMKELLAAFIAMELDLNVPGCVIINISSIFAESNRGKWYYSILSKSQGENFGTEYLDGAMIWNGETNLVKRYLSALQNIFLFDMLIDTTDRTIDKPNLLLRGDNLFLIDHEMSFGFTSIVLGDFEVPWLIKDYERSAAQNHILFSSIKGHKFESDNFLDKFIRINSKFWDKAEQLIPNGWKGTHFEKIKKIISLKIDNLSHYKKELKGLLS